MAPAGSGSFCSRCSASASVGRSALTSRFATQRWTTGFMLFFPNELRMTKALLLLALIPALAIGQATVSPGARVRVDLAGRGPFVTHLVWADRDSLTLRGCARCVELRVA